MKKYIETFFAEFDFPVEAQKELLEVYDKLQVNGIWEILKPYIDEYEEKDTTNWDEAALKIMDVSPKKGVSEYSVNLIFLICLTKHAKDVYEKAGHPYELYKANFSDLRTKLFECHKFRSVWGNGEIRYWYGRFYEMKIRSIGRFQFEEREFWDENDYVNGKTRIKKGDLTINIHIPSDGRPMDKEAIDASFREAYEFYKDLFDDGIVPFVLRSWLLYPKHKEFLPEDSNILKLMECFDIISYAEPHYGDWWRIFGKEYNDNIDEMPTETRLQRAYVDWVKKGNAPGFGRGVLLYKP